MSSEGTEQVPRQRIPWVRVSGATFVVVVLVGVALGYHDGAYDVDRLEEADAPGSYRFKGVIESYDSVALTFLLRDESGSRTLDWNVTTPEVGVRYVLEAERGEEGSLRALALSRVLVFHGAWFLAPQTISTASRSS